MYLLHTKTNQEKITQINVVCPVFSDPCKTHTADFDTVILYRG